MKQNQVLLLSKLDISAQSSITISKDNAIRDVPLENRTSLGRSIRIAFVNFAFERSKLSTSAKSVLDKVAQAAFEYKFSSISLTGHSDSKKTPIFDNLKLSQQRANQVQIYLLDRLQELGAANIKVDVSFYSSKRPIFIQDDRYSRSVNRRVEISIGK